MCKKTFYPPTLLKVAMNAKRLAMYPFLRESSEYIEEKNISLEELINGLAFEECRIIGKRRVLEAIEAGVITDHEMGTEITCLKEILSYPIARILVSCVGDPYLIRRYALAEAVKANHRLQNENLDFILHLAGQFNIGVNKYEDGVKIHFSDFLQNTAQLRSREWKLINQELDSGYVILNKRKLIRIVQQAIQKRIEQELPLPINDDIIRAFKRSVIEIEEEIKKKKHKFEATDIGKIRITRLPPCMKHLLSMAQNGENISHSGRFALTSFLNAVNLSPEDIIKIFSTSPDFDESKTRYQIEHITGGISGTEYTPPECSTMKSYNLCIGADELCNKEWMKHPLTYYRLKGRKRIKGRKKKS